MAGKRLNISMRSFQTISDLKLQGGLRVPSLTLIFCSGSQHLISGESLTIFKMNHEGQKHKYKYHDKSKTETRRYDRLLGNRDHGRQRTSLKI